MYNTYMSKEAFDNLVPGDEITVRQLGDLIHDFGRNMNIPCGWNPSMNELCGATLVVTHTEHDYEDGGIAWVHAQGYGWSFSRQMLEPKEGGQSMSQEEISQLWEEMILGKGDTNEKR